MKEPTTTQEAREMHDFDRRRAGRQSYIAWRMNDVPAVYQNLMPHSYQAKVLWEAEKAIRKQIEEDQKLLAGPWRRIGPVSNILDYEDMSSGDLLQFTIEAQVPVGMEDQPKPGTPFAKRPDDFKFQTDSQRQAKWLTDVRDEAQKAGLSTDDFLDLISSPESLSGNVAPAGLVAQFAAKVLLTFVAWVVYALVLHSPINPSFRGRKAALLSVLGFVLMIGVLIAVQLMPAGK